MDPYPGQGIEEDDEFFLLLPNAAGSHTLTRTGAWEVSFIHGFTQGAADDEPLHNADGVRVSIVNYNRSVYDVIIGGGRLYSISGAVAYGGPEAGPIYVQVFPSRWDVQPPPAPLDAMLVLAGTRPSWDYAVRYLPAGVSLYLRAFMDANSNGLFDAGSDPCGGLVNAAGDPAPVVLDADLTGVELNLRGLSWRLAPGWNAVSPPAATTLTLGEIVPHTRGERTAGAWWGWDAAAARYVWLPTDHVPARQAGLWTCSETDRVGALLNDETDGGAVNLAAGWNLVGPAARTILPAHPSLCATAWRWDGPAQAYHRVVPGNFLEPGQAYWLLAFEPVPELPLPSPAPGTAGR
ncbi:MAG: hypothetical protein BWZ02_03256 [Lentisphaerae bacterium ADurb.BinA184]|nr:MAG: hypothetical protein BWZ02_03256 [Lentisphaerae bacterium ADurb.BinA184]